MRILHLTERHAPESGGLTTMVNDLTAALSSDGIENVIVAVSDVYRDVPENVRFVGVPEAYWGVRGFLSYKLKKEVRKIYEDCKPDVVHVHGVWRPLQIAGASVATEMGIPFLVSAHGMYEPWLWSYQGMRGWMKKKVFFHLWAKPAFMHAQCFHAITEMEAHHIATLFPHRRIVNIPNAIHMPAWAGNSHRPHKEILFMGRVHAKKGLDLLVRSFARVQDGEWCLKIAGPVEDEDYWRGNLTLADAEGIADRIIYLGTIYGEEKWNQLKSAWVVVVPSHSEVIGIVNLEAGAVGTPSITTFETGLVDWEEGGGVLIHPNEDELVLALSEAIRWSLEERFERGKSIRALVSQRYSWDAVKERWEEIYSKMVGETG